MVIETSSQVNVNSESSTGMTSNDTQDGVQLVSIEIQDNDDDGHSVDSDNNRDEKATRTA